MASQRYTSEQQQEDLSIHQLSARLVEFGWLPPDKLSRDVGEDLLVRIPTRSQPVGVPFYIQLKSVTDMQERKRGDFLVYRSIEVDDLLRWESSPVPVVLVVWDVLLREGRWQSVNSIIASLDKRKQKWRQQQSTSVYIPWRSSTDDFGLRLLKAEIGQMLYPLIARDRPVTINVTLRFPDTEDATSERAAFERFVREGQPVSIEGRYIQEVKFSEWWAEWFVDPGIEITRIWSESVDSDEVEPATLTVFGKNQPSVHFSGLELKIVRAGTDVIVFSNRAQDIPLRITFSVPRGENPSRWSDIELTINMLGYNVLELRESLRLLRGIMSGGKLSVTLRRHGSTPLTMHRPQFPSSDHLPTDFLEHEEFVGHLCYIQERLGRPIVTPTHEFAASDFHAASELVEILQSARTIQRVDGLSLGVRDLQLVKNLLAKHSETPSGSQLMFQQESAESHVVLFGEKIQVGPMKRTIVGKLDVSTDEMQSFVDNGDSNAEFAIRLVGVEIIEEFPNWKEQQSLTSAKGEDHG